MEELAFEVGMEAVGMEDVGMVRMEVALLFVDRTSWTWTWKATAQATVDVAGVVAAVVVAVVVATGAPGVRAVMLCQAARVRAVAKDRAVGKDRAVAKDRIVASRAARVMLMVVRPIRRCSPHGCRLHQSSGRHRHTNT